MFDKEYSFIGTHADKVRELTAQLGSASQAKLFARNVDVYIVAPLVGFLYGRKSELDSSGNETTKIFPEQLLRELETLRFNYQLIMLLDKERAPTLDARMDKAFRHIGTEAAKPDEQAFESFVRGGVDILYEKLIEDGVDTDDYLLKLYEFLEQFHERYNEKVSDDIIIELCSLARS